MNKALVYCRVSTEEQAEKGHSLETQEKFCREFAKRNSYTVTHVYRDDGKSGKKLQRPALQALIAQIQEKKNVQAVIVQETDRLARNTIDHLTIRALLRKAGVKLLSAAQPMLDDSPEGKMIDTILASVNQFQSDINGRKTSKGMQERFDSGWWPAWAPLGYSNKMVDGKKIVTPDPKKWHLLRQGLKLYLTGNYSAMQIVDILHARGLRSQFGRRICNSIMSHILRNPFYAGIMRWKGQEKIGNHKPMITLSEHQRNLSILATHNYHASRSRKHRFLLMGFAFCNICGGRYTAEKHVTKGNITYYHCNFSGKRRDGKIHTNKGQNVPVPELEHEVEELFKRIEFNTETADKLIAKAQEVHVRVKRDTETQKKGIQNQRLALEQKRDVIEEKLLAGVITDSEFQRLRNKLNDQFVQVQTQFIELEQEHDDIMDVLRDIVMIARDVYNAYRNASYEEKRKYLALFWEKFLIEDKRIIKAMPTSLLAAMLHDKKVIVSGNLCPTPKLLITLRNRQIFHTVQNLVREIQGYSAEKNRSAVAT